MARGVTPLPLLGVVLLLFLAWPVGAFLFRLAGSSPHDLTSPGTGRALLVSIETATITSVVTLALGVPLAYVLAQGRSRTSAIVGLAVQLPLALPPLMSGILLLYVVGPYTAIGRAFGGHLTDDRLGIVLAQIFVAAPFLVVAARSSFAALDPALDDVAATLGLSRWARFARVAVPAAAPGIAAGLALTWLRAFGEFGATVVLAYHPYSLPVLTYLQFGSIGLKATLLPAAAAIGAAIVLVGVVAGGRGLRGAMRRTQVLPDPRRPEHLPTIPLQVDVRGEIGTFAGSLHTDSPTRRLAVVGASGAGKTFALRMLAGLVDTTSGTITLGEDSLHSMPTQDRMVGYVPQDAALIPAMSVWRQVTLGKNSDPHIASHWLHQFGLADLADRRPDQLSGGQRHRVALVRALAVQPRLLLLDEPFSGLDATIRDDLRSQLARVQADSGVTTVIVTHDPSDATYLADHVAVIDQGIVVQQGRLGDVCAAPADVNVARLLGIRNVVAGTVMRTGVVTIGGTEVHADTRTLSIGEPVYVRLSPRGFQVPSDTGMSGVLVRVVDKDTHIECELQLSDGTTLIAAVNEPPAATPGSVITVGTLPNAVTCWPAAKATP